MADSIVVRAPDGSIVEIPEAQYQDALNQGYTNVPQAEAESARDTAIATAGPDTAVSAGLLEAPDDYDRGLAGREKILSGFTFGQADELNTPEARARGKRYTEEHPYQSMFDEGVGQIPLAIAGAAGGAAAGAAVKGASIAARAGVAAADFGANALVGGAQVEGEASRLSGEDFSFTDAAIVGSVGEVLGRGAAWGVARGVGGARNLLARGEREVIAQDAAEGLTRGGWVRDYQTAQHAEAYHSQLADLAARDLDTLESAFGEVSRQDRKRARIIRTVTDNPAAQREVNIAELNHLRSLQTALGEEIADAPAGPARNLARQLQERIDVLDSAPSGKKLWRALDENRQALQEYRQDLYQAYETNPGSAWLSRDGLAAIDAAEKSTREALLREDVWGQAAAQAQREYNEPFHTKWFPSRKTVVGKLHFEQMRNAEGFAVYRGDPDAVKRFLSRDLAEPDGARLAEQFTEYLDGAEAIARAGSKDSPRASRDALEAIRRLRKAQANAAHVTAAVARTTRRTTGINQAAMVAGAAGGLAAGGPGGAALGALAARGARVGDWLSRAGTKLGWGAGAPLDMAALLGKGALPDVTDDAARVSARLTDDIIDGPFRPASDLPPLGGPGGPLTPQATRGVGTMDPARPEARPGVGPVRLDPRGQDVRPRNANAIIPTRQRDVGPDPRGLADTEPAPPSGPSTLPPSGGPGGSTPIDDLDPGATPIDELAPDGPSASPYDGPRVDANAEFEAAMAPKRAARAADARRAEALSQGEFQDLVTRLRDVDAKTPDGGSMADELESSIDNLIDDGLVAPESGVRLSWGELARQAKEAGALQPMDSPIARSMREGAAAREVDRRSAAEQAEAATAELRSQLDPRHEMDPEVGPAVAAVFGRTPSPETFARMAPLDTLSKLGTVKSSKWGVGSSGELWWQAQGPRMPDNKAAWNIVRTYDRVAGNIRVHHEMFIVHKEVQGSGAGMAVIRDQIQAYRELGVTHVDISAIDVGRWLWPSMGFDVITPAMLSDAKREAAEWLVFAGRMTEAEAAKEMASIKSLPSLANREWGKEFLLDVSGSWNDGMVLKISDSNPLFQMCLQRLDIAVASGMLVAGASLEGDGSDAAAAGAMAPMALFGRRASLFKGVRARVVAQAARRLFSATADALPRVTARLVYSRSQIEERQREFQTWQANPQELVDRVAEGFRDVPPEHSGTVAGGVFRTATFLQEKLPSVTRTNAVSVRQIPVSAEAMAKYARYEQAALTPRDAIAEASESRHLSTELLETLQELYPDLLAELRVQAYMQVREAGPPTTIQGRLSYAQLFDGDGTIADPAFSMDVAQMAAYAYEQSVPPKPPASGGTPGVSRAAVSVAAPGPLGRV